MTNSDFHRPADSLDLKPCPFCGGPATKAIAVVSDCQIRCENDDCIGPHTTAYNEADVIRQWNARPATVAQPAVVWGPTQEDVVAHAIMLDDGCGLTVNGQRVLCDDPRAMEKPERCYCRRAARAALAGIAAQPPAAPVETSEVADLRCLVATYANEAAQAKAELESHQRSSADIERERDEARQLVIEANNSLYGSQGYFHSLNGGPFDKYHLSRGIEKLKADNRHLYAAGPQPAPTREQIARAWLYGHCAARGFGFAEIDYEGCKGSKLWHDSFDMADRLSSQLSRPELGAGK
jgi:hypothetical protein